MAEDGRILDSTYFSAKAAEIQYKRLALISQPVVGEIEHIGMKIEFLSNGGMKVDGGFRIVVEDGVAFIFPPPVSAS